MWEICANVYKKRRVEPRINFERKLGKFNPLLLHKLHKVKSRRTKRKIFYDLPNHAKRLKYKSQHCLIHEEQYICDIYECSGVHIYQPFDFMPYIN